MCIKNCVICRKEIPEKRIKQNKDTCCKSCAAVKMNKLRRLDANYKKKRSEAAKRLWSNPEYKEKVSKAIREHWSEENRQRQSNILKASWSEENKQRQSNILKASWSNEELRQKQSEISKVIWSNEKTRQKASDSHKSLWQDTTYRNKMINSFIVAQNNPETKAKMSKSTSIALSRPEVRQKLSNSIKRAYELHGDEIKMKQMATKKANGTVKYSKAEKQILTLLKEKFNKVQYQYDKDARYPFRCDFYIPELDLFIEYNGNWTHGGAPYNENELWCKEQLSKWQEKAKTSEYYKSAISVWTYWDIKKVSIAKANRLNLKVFYTIEQFNLWYKGGLT